MTALAAPMQTGQPGAGEDATEEPPPEAAPQGNSAPTPCEPVPAPKRSPAHYLWAALIARIYEVFPLLCPICGGQMRLIAFITNTAEVRKILEHIGVDPAPPRITPPRGPPLWDNCDASADEVPDALPLPDWDEAAQPEPDDCADQRIHW